MGRWGSFSLYLLAALAYAACIAIPSLSRRADSLFPPGARGAVAATCTFAGLPLWAVLLFHLASGDVWLSPRVTPFSHTGWLPYLVGGLSFAAVATVFLVLVQSFAESLLRHRPGILRAERRVCMAISTFVLCGVLIEVGLRVYAVSFPQTDGLGVTPGTAFWKRRYVELNSLGFREEEFGPKSPGEYRVVVLGDSLVFGYGISRTEDRCTEVLERLLGESLETREGVVKPLIPRVLNIAKPGADSLTQLQWLQDVVLPLNPDLVLLGHYWNDITHARRQPTGSTASEPRPRVVLSFKRVVKIWLQTQSALSAQLIKLRLLLKYRKAKAGDYLLALYADSGTYPRHLEVLKRLHATCQEKHIPFAVLILPYFAVPFDENPLMPLGKKLEEDLGNRNVPAFHLLSREPPDFKGGWEVWVNSSDSHPDETGHAYIAKGLYRLVAEMDPDWFR
jgi:lysophospholipase L1-like esterase